MLQEANSRKLLQSVRVVLVVVVAVAVLVLAAAELLVVVAVAATLHWMQMPIYKLVWITYDENKFTATEHHGSIEFLFGLIRFFLYSQQFYFYEFILLNFCKKLICIVGENEWL